MAFTTANALTATMSKPNIPNILPASFAFLLVAFLNQSGSFVNFIGPIILSGHKEQAASLGLE